MVTLRSNATATVIQGKIYVTGGFYVNEGGPLNSVECYHPERGWLMVCFFFFFFFLYWKHAFQKI